MGWNFDHSYGHLPGLFHVKMRAEPVASPSLVVLNEPLAKELGLEPAELKAKGAAWFSGNEIIPGAEPLAQAYAGHQYGHLNMLGDGRALLLGEQLTPAGHRFDIQLKGSGRTPFSRGGDGRAALGPMLREYIISEALHALGVPGTRSLAVVATGEQVRREEILPGAVLARVAASHLRVGTFEYAAGNGEEALRALADYAIARHYPELKDESDKHLKFLRAVIERQAALIAEWMRVGFVHGVMNTDNVAISGETIDFGPCAFMDSYSPATVFSSIDRHGRYAYGNQPRIAAWNLARFAEALLPLLDLNEARAAEKAREELERFGFLYEAEWLQMMRGKLGLFRAESEDEVLFSSLLGWLERENADWTNTFRSLARGEKLEGGLKGDWFARWKLRLSRQEESWGRSAALMLSRNPDVIPRNHRVEEALAAATGGDHSVMEKLLGVLARPYEQDPSHDEYRAPKNEEGYKTFCGT